MYPFWRVKILQVLFLSISIFDIVYLLQCVLCNVYSIQYHTSIGFYFRLHLDKHTCSSPKMCLYFAYIYVYMRMYFRFFSCKFYKFVLAPPKMLKSIGVSATNFTTTDPSRNPYCTMSILYCTVMYTSFATFVKWNSPFILLFLRDGGGVHSIFA
jgi:hypothetical protein